MSLRTRIALLVLLATLAPAALFGLYVYQHREGEIVDAKQSLSALATNAVENLSDKVSGTVQLLHGLSRARDLDSLDKETCSVFLSEVLKRYPQYTGLLTIRPDGQLHCDSLLSGRTLNLNDRAYFRQARASSEPAFEVVFGRITGIAVLQVAFPARDSRGELQYVLLASLNLAQFSARFAKASPLPGVEVVIWDDKGTVMARHPDDAAKRLSGSSFAESALYRFVQSGQAGQTAELAGPDGTLKIWALGMLPAAASGGLRLTLGIPRDVLLADIDGDARRALTNLAILSLVAFVGALLFAELAIRRHVARITAAAERLRIGDLGARIAAPYPRNELGDLMAALDASAAAVQAQQVEIERNAEELRRTNRTLRMLSAINSTIVRVHEKEKLLSEACRIAAEDGQFPIVWAGMLDAESMQVKPVAWQGVDEAYVQSIPRTVTDKDSLVGLVIRLKHSVVVNDVAGDLRMTKMKAAMALGSRSVAALPLIVSDEPVGVFVMHAREVGFFHEEELKLLIELAKGISFALEYIDRSEKLDHLAFYDPLTGLANRAMFYKRLAQFLNMPGREDRIFALVAADIEHFRNINDTFGRPAGDELLKQIAARASHEMTDARLLARVGADQFVFMIPDEAERDGVARRIERWQREVFGKPFHLGAIDMQVTARFGIALFPGDAADVDALIRNAESALKKAKASTERYLFYVPQMN